MPAQKRNLIEWKNRFHIASNPYFQRAGLTFLERNIFCSNLVVSFILRANPRLPEDAGSTEFDLTLPLPASTAPTLPLRLSYL
jgi:hypothetical protein